MTAAILWTVPRNLEFLVYSQLLRNCEPVLVNKSVFVWKRTVQPRSVDPVTCKAGPKGDCLTLVDAPPGPVAVELDYRFDGPDRNLVMIENRYSFAAGSGGAVSVDPNGRFVRFPVLPSEAGST